MAAQVKNRGDSWRRAMVPGLLLLALTFSRGEAAQPKGLENQGSRLSPSAVLARSDALVGERGVSFPRGPLDSVDPAEDRTLAPYFHIDGEESSLEKFPLEETSADVQIAGVIARVQVRQVFKNAGNKPIEAVYVFPASTRAAVHGMRMTIGERTIEARIERRQAARQQYEEAMKQGKRASLLEQERPNVFTMNVANIMPGERIRVELDYSELLVPEDATYEFVYPTVVGPRYGGGADPVKDRWIANPYLKEGQKEPYQFSIKARVETGIALKELASPSHDIAVDYLSPSSADVRLSKPGGGNKDFVLRYRLAGDQVETGLLRWKGEKENFFLMMMEPPLRPTAAQIPPREYIFLLDVSGSMHGYPLDTAKELMRKLLSQLRPSDYFNVALFSGASFVMNREGSLAATPGNIKMATELIERQRGGGGTELTGGLEAVYAIPRLEQGVSRSVVVVTDGYVGVEAKSFKFIRERLNQANLFAFGIGSSVNRGLIEAMARAGQGEPFVVLGPESAAAQANKLREYIEKPVLAGIEVRFKGLDAYEVAPAKVPDLMARRPVVLFGKYRGEARGSIEVSGFSGSGSWSKSVEVASASEGAQNAALRWLWARRWAQLLDDQLKLMPGDKEVEEAITGLGLDYTLLTGFTSFVAIDSEVANRTGASDQVKQPLPLPEGVSNHAVGGGMAAAAPSPPAMRRRSAAPSTQSSSGLWGAGGLGGERKSTGFGGLGRRGLAEQAAKDEVAEDGKPAPRLIVMNYRPTGLGDSAALVAAVEQRLKAMQGCPLDPETKLRLVIDKTGKVVRVELEGRASKPGLQACLAKVLMGLTSATRATGDQGTLVLTLKLASF